jgi:hypothetical protein
VARRLRHELSLASQQQKGARKALPQFRKHPDCKVLTLPWRELPEDSEHGLVSDANGSARARLVDQFRVEPVHVDGVVDYADSARPPGGTGEAPRHVARDGHDSIGSGKHDGAHRAAEAPGRQGVAAVDHQGDRPAHGEGADQTRADGVGVYDTRTQGPDDPA